MCWCRFIVNAATGNGIDRYGEIEAVKFNTDENFNQTESYIGKLVSRERFDHIVEWTNAFYDRSRRPLPTPDHRGAHSREPRRPPPRQYLLRRIRRSSSTASSSTSVFAAATWRSISPSWPWTSISTVGPIWRGTLSTATWKLPATSNWSSCLNFYKCYRAYVRAKIACFTSVDPALDDTAKRKQRNLARRYFGLAYHYAGGTEKPSLVVLYGLMGSGKTSIARHLREEYGWHLLSTDAIRKQISGVGEATRVYVPYNEGLYSPEMNSTTYAEVCERAENLLLGGFNVVVDGAFKRQAERLPVIELAQRAGARLVFLRTTCKVRSSTAASPSGNSTTPARTVGWS